MEFFNMYNFKSTSSISSGTKTRKMEGSENGKKGN